MMTDFLLGNADLLMWHEHDHDVGCGHELMTTMVTMVMRMMMMTTNYF